MFRSTRKMRCVTWVVPISAPTSLMTALIWNLEHEPARPLQNTIGVLRHDIRNGTFSSSVSGPALSKVLNRIFETPDGAGRISWQNMRSVTSKTFWKQIPQFVTTERLWKTGFKNPRMRQILWKYTTLSRSLLHSSRTLTLNLNCVLLDLVDLSVSILDYFPLVRNPTVLFLEFTMIHKSLVSLFRDFQRLITLGLVWTFVE